MRNTTRGRSMTSFPRNTREAHRRHCAQVARETERAYEQYQPRQVRLGAQMQKGMTPEQVELAIADSILFGKVRAS